MSLLSTERYIAILGADGVGLCRRSKDGLVWLGRVDNKEEARSSWLAATEALTYLLEQVPSQRKSELCILVSNHFIRYCLLPWSEQIDSLRELKSYAEICFEEIYGSLGNEWHFRFSPQASGQDRLAAAMPAALIAGLQQSANDRGWRLRSIQPYLMAAFNRFANALPTQDFLFILAEPKRSTLLLAQSGHWSHVRSLSSIDSDQALGILIARETELQALDGMSAAPVYFHAPDRVKAFPIPICGVSTYPLSLPLSEASEDYLYTMAMAVT
ncbi:hypothetical protein [Oceanisphaera profunda]|uniref:hypothetical protein n=1 Tax=Oceanisphaera profunda TaxID=1416627 RepID=UPI00125F8A37|nr:hypothetical protein [Oceanisphaera profunda]